MLYRIARWKLESKDLQSFKQGLVSLSRRRTFTKRPVKVDIPVLVVDKREEAFRCFTEIASIDRKRKNKRGYYLKNQKSNTFLEWFGMSDNNSSAIVKSGYNSPGVSALTRNKTETKPSVDSDVNASNIIYLLEETHEDLDIRTSLPLTSFRPKIEIIEMEQETVKDGDSKITKPTRKALIKKVDSIHLIVAMLSVLSLDDKRKIKESETEHFETFQAHRLNARPNAKKMKTSNN